MVDKLDDTLEDKINKIKAKIVTTEQMRNKSSSYLFRKELVEYFDVAKELKTEVEYFNGGKEK